MIPLAMKPHGCADCTKKGHPAKDGPSLRLTLPRVIIPKHAMGVALRLRVPMEHYLHLAEVQEPLGVVPLALLSVPGQAANFA